MNRERLVAAMAAVIDEIRNMGSDAFRAQILANEPGDLAQALAEIESFAAGYLGDDVLVPAAVRAAILWGAVNAETFGLADLESWIASNDDRFRMAA